MRKVFLFIAAALLANLSIVSAASFTGFDANNRLGYLIDNEDLIQNKVNVAVNQTTESYNHTISLIDVGEGTFTMGGVTFSYTHKSEPGKIAYKVYDNYIQPNGADRIIRIPTMEGEKVKIVLLESCSGILVDGVSKDFMGGENILTANGSSIILKNSSYKPKIKAILPVEDDPNLDNAHTVKLLGTFINSYDWSYTDVFTVASDSLSASLTLSLEAREYSFGVDVGGEWCANGATFTCSDNSSTGINPTTGNNMKLVASKAGEYTFTWIFATNTLTIVCPNSLFATIDGISYAFDTDMHTAEVKANDYKGDVKIPSAVTYNNTSYSVTSIGANAFKSCSGLSSVTIGTNIENMGDGAFDECTGLTKVNITDIGAWCQIHFEALNSNPLYYAKHLYLNNTEITKLIIPDGLTSINGRAFCNCTSLTSVIIGNGIWSINTEAFYGCSSLQSINIPDGVTDIYGSVFYGCSSLQSISIPSSVTGIGKTAFSGCSALKSVTCEAVTPPTMSNNVFKNVNCSSITLYVPSGSLDAYKSADQWKEFNPIMPLDISTCTEAAAAALTVSADNELYNGGKVYTITAKVSEIVTEWKDGSMTFWMAEKTDGGRVLEAYKCSIPKKENDVLIGDKVAVTGQLTKNKNTPMFSSGCTVEVIRRDTITCTTAAKKANNNKTEERVIKGYVTSITEAWTSAYKNVTFWMADTYNGGQVFQAYRVQCKNEEDAPEVGDHVWVRGKITKYGDSVHGVTIFRTASGGTFGVLATPVLPDPRNCAEAAEAALSVSANGELYKKGQKYTIKGYVTAIANEWSSNYLNISFWMADTKDGGQVLQAYRASCISGYYAPKIGDCVRVTGSLTKHGETPEFAEGCTFEIIDEYELQNCSEAAVAALSVSKDKELYNNGKEYRLVGFVTAIATEWNSNYKNISFWMADTYDGGEVLEAYRAVCKSKSDAPQVGDYVSVSGSLTKYGGTPEFAEGCTFSILSRGRAEEIVTSDITATLTEDGNAIFEWTSVDDADTYTIALYRDGRWIYTYIFNAEGQLINFYSQLISYFTLARADRERNVEMAEQTAKGWRFIVNGLITDATYSCSVTCKNKNNTVLFSKTIDFALPGALQSTNNVQTDADKLIKVIRDGQLLILREGKVYSVQGQEVR